MSEKIRIQNDNGREFTVKLVHTGDTYGRDKCLTNDDDETFVEFYDATYADDDRFPAEGQFVSRYHASTLMGDEYGDPIGMGQGLCLDGGIPDWSVDGEAMRVVAAFVKANV